MILIIAPRTEPNLQRLFTAAAWAKVPLLHLDTSLLPPVTAWITNERFPASPLRVAGSEIASEEITGVWTRGLGLKRPAGLAGAENLIHAEWHTFLNYLGEWARHAKWANHLDALIASGNKLRQLALASQLGFDVPRSLITTDSATAREFLNEERCLIIKRMSQGNAWENADRILFAKKLSAEDECYLDNLGPAPVFLQSMKEKKVELRTIVVGERVFSAGFAASEHEQTSVDTRHWYTTDDSYFGYKLSPEIEHMAVELTKSLGLTYGALDLIVDHNERVTFLELNNAGQWGWIEAATGFSITQSIIQELAE